MKSLAFFLSLVMTCLASNTADVSVRKPLDYVVQNNTTLITMSLSSDLKESVNTGLAVSEVTVNSAQLLLKGVQSIVRSKLLKVMSSFLGPAGAVIGVIGDVMGLFEDKAPEIEQLFAAQTAFISESFIAMSNQVVLPILN